MTTEGVARLITYQRGDTIRVRDGFSPRFHDDCSHRALWRFISCRTLPSRPLSWSIPHTHSPPSKVFAIRILFCMESAAHCRWNNLPTLLWKWSREIEICNPLVFCLLLQMNLSLNIVSCLMKYIIHFEHENFSLLCLFFMQKNDWIRYIYDAKLNHKLRILFWQT